MTEAGWEHFEVEADVGVRGWGDSRAAAWLSPSSPWASSP
jgi:hypothetical protein